MNNYAAARIDQAAGTAIIPALERYVRDLNIKVDKDTKKNIL
jgi:hypothetical protein